MRRPAGQPSRLRVLSSAGGYQVALNQGALREVVHGPAAPGARRQLLDVVGDERGEQALDEGLRKPVSPENFGFSGLLDVTTEYSSRHPAACPSAEIAMRLTGLLWTRIRARPSSEMKRI